MSLAKRRVGGTSARTRPRIIASAIWPAPRNAIFGMSVTARHLQAESRPRNGPGRLYSAWHDEGVNSMAAATVIGQRAPRVEGVGKVNGSAQYALDKLLPGIVWGKALRSPHAYARIKR